MEILLKALKSHMTPLKSKKMPELAHAGTGEFMGFGNSAYNEALYNGRTERRFSFSIVVGYEGKVYRLALV